MATSRALNASRKKVLKWNSLSQLTFQNRVPVLWRITPGDVEINYRWDRSVRWY
jgi:hypothetical protein